MEKDFLIRHPLNFKQENNTYKIPIWFSLALEIPVNRIESKNLYRKYIKQWIETGKSEIQYASFKEWI